MEVKSIKWKVKSLYLEKEAISLRIVPLKKIDFMVKRSMNRLNKTFLSTAILLAGIIFMIAGINRGELDEIMRKAVVVCLECIGIG